VWPAGRGDTSTRAALRRPEAYTPKHLAERILTSKAALEGERKQVTVLFADLKGSMELLADRDPEEARKILWVLVAYDPPPAIRRVAGFHGVQEIPDEAEPRIRRGGEALVGFGQGRGARSPEESSMTLYGKYVLPVLTDLAMRNKGATAERARWVPMAAGVVLEIGAGSGLNFTHYGPDVRKVYALDPSAELRRMAGPRAERARVLIEFLAAPAEAVPLPDGSVDTVVTTWTLCTIPDPQGALHEMGRVLRGGGRLIFVEHGRASDPRVVRWQERLTPAWRRIAGGCHLNRPIAALIEAGSFEVTEMECGYARGPRVSAYLYRGVARLRESGRGAPSDEVRSTAGPMKGVSHGE
jgi:SAM-dependent methyltransferase